MQTVRMNTQPDFAALLQPARHHPTPASVLDDPDLDRSEKRAILSSWASDFYAVESCPTLRTIPGVAGSIRLADILAALRTLDGDPPPRGGASARVTPLRWTKRWRPGARRLYADDAVAA
jgi:hypothetical protein